ncbi:TetR/AcrR family transcriptional regulator [Maritalea porphyrae]|uniref:TetR/AcrR family transcriptional regulator n=1 Tax=Maritalea porphyrae TaxID=880732 RepID=UPI0022AE8499|nr:TetR/AcrR family transcriptional regulator [Maritalea porphyrae]MCZ4272637.1 TetR/AcrR family transcriptional regulator [Maritalea porphyrae]
MAQAVRLGDEELTARQQDVLDIALSLLVEVGDKLTMTGVARRARCSKESLYKWFGDRDGLLTAIVQWQAAKVRSVPVGPQRMSREALQSHLEQFAFDWLKVISGDISVALNRLAITHAGPLSNLGTTVLMNGRFAVGQRLKPLLKAGRGAGLLHFSDEEEAFRTFFGLVIKDVQIRLLLGEDLVLSETDVVRDAKRAVEQFVTLYGVR